MNQASRLIGTGSAFPSTVVTNHDLVKRLSARGIETTDEWIQERTGIQARRIATPGNADETGSSLALRASLQALEMAGKRPEDIDQIIFATCTPDTLIPSSACWLQSKLGAKKAWAFDVNAACSGFVYALATADQFIQTGRAQNALVVGSEVLTAFTNWDDRGSCILFGDGAGAVVVERTEAASPRRILSFKLHSDGNLWDLFHIPAGGSAAELTPERFSKHEGKMQMKGREMFKVAVKTLADFAATTLKENGLEPNELDWFVPHQANLRIIEAVAKRLSFPMEKVLVNIQNFGNTSSATVPTALDQAVRSGKIQPGQTVLMDVFGAGLTYGALLVRW